MNYLTKPFYIRLPSSSSPHSKENNRDRIYAESVHESERENMLLTRIYVESVAFEDPKYRVVGEEFLVTREVLSVDSHLRPLQTLLPLQLHRPIPRLLSYQDDNILLRYKHLF